MRPFRRPLFLGLALALAAFAHTTQATSTGGPGGLVCAPDAKPVSISAALKTPMEAAGITPGPSDAAWLKTVLVNVSLKPDLPAETRAKDLALRTGSLVRRGHIVAAKLSHDDAMTHPAYAAATFSRSIAIFIDGSVQPIHHQQDGKIPAINVAVAKVLAAEKQLGKLYGFDPVRYFVIAHAITDPVGIQVARPLVCALRLTPAAVRQIGAVAEASRFAVK